MQRFLEAAEKERREAREKHKPFKPDIVADDLVSMIRQMGNKSSPVRFAQKYAANFFKRPDFCSDQS